MEFDIKNIKAIIGLGNPGLKYYKNRHNIGFRILDKIAQFFSANWSVADVMEDAKIFYEMDGTSVTIILVKPQTFMNNSGRVLSFLQKKGIKSENILVAHDELEKKFGDLSLKFGGSARGHNGLRSIISIIGPDFWRFRFGIGRPQEARDVADYVLSNFSVEEEKEIDFLVNTAIEKIFQK